MLAAANEQPSSIVGLTVGFVSRALRGYRFTTGRVSKKKGEDLMKLRTIVFVALLLASVLASLAVSGTPIQPIGQCDDCITHHKICSRVQTMMLMLCQGVGNSQEQCEKESATTYVECMKSAGCLVQF